MERKLEILILEDNPDDAKLVERALRSGGIEFAAQRVETQEDFLRALEKRAPDVILADYRLPHFDGRSALKLAGERLPQVPVIIVTGTMVDEVAVELLSEGAVDYVLKDRLSRLAPAVRRALEVAQARTARREAEEKYRVLFAQARDGIVLLEAESGSIADCNAEFAKQAARPLAELQKLCIWELRSPEKVEAARRKYLELRHNIDESEDRLEICRPDGSQITVEFRAKAIELGGKRYVQALVRDITERLRRERQLQAQMEELRRFQRVTVDRELRLQELEERIANLTAESVKVP